MVETETGTQHCGLKDWNRTAFKIRHVLATACKYGAIGGGVIGAGMGLFNLMIGFALGGAAVGGATSLATAAFAKMPLVGAIGFLLLPFAVLGGAGAVAASAWTAVASGALIGGIAGLALGAVMGLSSADEAADQEEAKLMDRYDQMVTRRERKLEIEQRRDDMRTAMHEREIELQQAPARGLPQTRLPLRQERMEGVG